MKKIIKEIKFYMDFAFDFLLIAAFAAFAVSFAAYTYNLHW